MLNFNGVLDISKTKGGLKVNIIPPDATIIKIKSGTIAPYEHLHLRFPNLEGKKYKVIIYEEKPMSPSESGNVLYCPICNIEFDANSHRCTHCGQKGVIETNGVSMF
jgi:hypothetical protein